MFPPYSKTFKAPIFYNVQTGIQVQGLLWYVERVWAVGSEGDLSLNLDSATC